jgi:hypothetical protein
LLGGPLLPIAPEAGTPPIPGDAHSWTALAYLLLRLPLGLGYFLLAALCLLLPGFFLWAGAWLVSGQIQPYAADPFNPLGLHELLNGNVLHETAGLMHIHGAPDWLMPWLQAPRPLGLAAILAGILVFLPLLRLIRAVGRWHGRFAGRLLFNQASGAAASSDASAATIT